MDTTEPVNLYDTLESWANDENRAIHADIQKEQSELQSAKTDCAELHDRVAILKDHLKNVQTEIERTQQLLTAKNQAVEAERHLTQLVLRERGKIESELNRIEEQTMTIKGKWTEVQTKTSISQQRIEAFREEEKMNQQELEQWIMIARQKEEDFLVLHRYQREDEGRIRSMLLEIEKSTGIIEAKKKELENEVTATRALQIELDMTAEHFREQHEERSKLLNQWESAMKQMQTLNERIEQYTSDYDKRKIEVDNLHADVATEKKNLDSAESENQSIERQLTIGDHKVSQEHKRLEKDNHELNEFMETIETQKHQLEKLSSDQRALQEKIQQFKDQTAQEIQKKEDYMKRLNNTELALATQNDLTKDFDDQTNVMNEFLRKQESELKRLESEIDNGKQSIFKLSQEVSTVKKNQKDLRAEMEGSQTRAKNLQLKIQEFDRETQKQMELLYNSNFQIQQMERKIARIEGERTEEEKIELQSQIDQLSEKLERKVEVEKVLSLQLHRLDLDLRQTARKKVQINEAKTHLENKLNEIRLDQESLDKSTVKSRSQKEIILVQLNMLRLQVEKLTEQVNMKSDELISLENRRLQLQLSMAERVLEIDAHLAALRTQLKTEEEARHKSGIELKERMKRSETLETKYHVIMGKYQDEGEEASQSYHIIQFTKEREEVSRRGDELNEEVKKAAQELNQLEKAMNKLNNHNTEFRHAFNSVTESDTDMERKKVLEEQVHVAQQRLNARKAQASSIAQEKRERLKTYQEQEVAIDKMQKEIARLKPSVEKISAENAEIKEKMSRVQKLLLKAREKHRTENNIPQNSQYPATLLEMDIELRMEKLNFELAINELNKIAQTNLEIIPKLKLAAAQIGIPIQAMPALQQAPVQEQRASGLLPKGPRIISPNSGLSSRSGSSNGSQASSRSTSSVHSNASYASNASGRSRASKGSVSKSSHQPLPSLNKLNLNFN